MLKPTPEVETDSMLRPNSEGVGAIRMQETDSRGLELIRMLILARDADTDSDVETDSDVDADSDYRYRHKKRNRK